MYKLKRTVMSMGLLLGIVLVSCAERSETIEVIENPTTTIEVASGHPLQAATDRVLTSKMRYLAAVHQNEQLEIWNEAVAEYKAEQAELARQEQLKKKQQQEEKEEVVEAKTHVDSGGGVSDGSLSRLRACESGGDYGAVSGSGSYRGAYQFNQQTWNSVASGSYPHLVGVDPASASPADQDRMARALFSQRGRQPWPHCGKKM